MSKTIHNENYFKCYETVECMQMCNLHTREFAYKRSHVVSSFYDPARRSPWSPGPSHLCRSTVVHEHHVIFSRDFLKVSPVFPLILSLVLESVDKHKHSYFATETH